MLLGTLRYAIKQYTETISEELDGQGIPFNIVTTPAVEVPMIELIRAAMSEKGLICHAWKRGEVLNVAWTSKDDPTVTLYAQAD